MSKRRPPKKNIRQYWFGIFCIILFLLFWVSQSVRSTQISYEIQTLEDKIKEEKNKQVELKIERDRYLSLDYVETIARKKCGLIPPLKENIVLMNLSE